MKVESPDYEEAPTHYPCIAEILQGSDENSYPKYIYLETVEIMRKALTSLQGNAAGRLKPGEKGKGR